MCGNKGATTSSTTAPPQAVQDMYKYLTEQGKALQQQPYTPYTGQLVSPLNEIQQQGIAQTQQYSQAAQPYYQASAGATAGALGGLSPEGFQQGVQGYMSPYLQNALGATAAQMQNVNEQQQQQLLGNAIRQGAFGGDRGQIARAALINQQNLALGQTLGQMAQQGYQTAAQNYLQGIGQQGALAQQLGGLGTLAQQQGLAGASAVGQAGAVPYAVQQAQNAANYQQFAQQQAYPYQTLGFLANVASGLGAGQGGTSVTTTPGPSGISQLVGGLTTLGSLFKFADGGAVDRQGHAHGGDASQGGLVPAGMERHPYAVEGSVPLSFGVIPYEEDPLYAAMAAYAKTPVLSYVPKGQSIKGAVLNIKEAPEYKDEPSPYTKGTSPMPDWEKINLSSNIKKFILDPMGINATARTTESYGGLVPRTHHGDGQTPDGATVPAQPKMTLAEHLFGPMSDDARSAMLAAGLGMLASRSPFPGVAIGEGALGGVNTYYNAMKNRMEQAKAASEIGLQGAQTEEARARTKNVPLQYGLDVFKAQIDAYRQAQETLPLLQQRAKAYLLTPGGTVPPELQSAIDALTATLSKGPPTLGGVSPVLPSISAQPPEKQTTPLTGTDLVVPKTTPKGETPKGMVVPAPDTDQTVKPQSQVETKQPVQASAQLEAAKSGFNLPPNYDPDVLFAQADAAAQNGFADTAIELRRQANQNLNEITNHGGITIKGQFIPLPGYQEAMAARDAAKTTATEEAKSKFEMVDVTRPDGSVVQIPKSDALRLGIIQKSLSPAEVEKMKERAKSEFELVEVMNRDGTTVLKRKSELLPKDTEVSAGAGSPPGSAADAGASDTVKKLPEWQIKAREKINEDEMSMGDNYRKRLVSLSRLNGLIDILSTYQTGAYEGMKSDLINRMASLGFNIPPEATEKAANFEKFTKGAIQEVFNSLPGGKILQSEIQGLAKANANAGMLASSNAKILGDARALVNYENKYTQDYLNWRAANPNAYSPTDVAKFDLQWSSKPENNLDRFKAEEARKIGYVGQAIPDAPIHGKAYYVPSAKETRFWDKNADLGGGKKGGWVKTDPLAGAQ